MAATALRRSSGIPKFPPSAQHRYSSSKSGSAMGERDVPPSGPNSGFSDAIVSDVVGGAGDANSAGSTGTPASPSVPTDRKSYMPTAEWLNSEEGRKYRRPQSGRPNWLGRTPFPLNPTFKPPTPISNAQKERIYRAFVESLENAKATASAGSSSSSSGTSSPKSETFHLRQLSLQFGLSIDRVRAIVRLKALEKNLAAQGTQLQIAFLSGMEQALGVSTGKQLSIREPADVAKETRQMYGVGRKTRYIMLDEENVEDVEEVEKELERRERRKAKGEGEHPDIAVDSHPSGPDSTKYVRANVQKTLKANRKVELQFKDVPSTASSDSASGASSSVQ